MVWGFPDMAALGPDAGAAVDPGLQRPQQTMLAPGWPRGAIAAIARGSPPAATGNSRRPAVDERAGAALCLAGA
ncbi:MAG: hypothetical protein ACLPNY_05960 [Roseiarcus sp.]